MKLSVPGVCMFLHISVLYAPLSVPLLLLFKKKCLTWYLVAGQARVSCPDTPMGWGAVAAQLCGNLPGSDTGHEGTATATGTARPRPFEGPEEATLDSELDQECWDEIDDLHSDSSGELSQRTDGSDPGNRSWWASLLMDHTHSLKMTPPTRETPVRLISCCTGSFAEGVVMEDSLDRGEGFSGSNKVFH